MNRNNGVKDLPTSCERPAAMLAVSSSDSGYRIRCLECEAVGPEREDISSAWAALQSRCFAPIKKSASAGGIATDSKDLQFVHRSIEQDAELSENSR